MKMIAGRCLLCLLEEIPHPRGSHADDHLDELRGGHLEEGDAGLAGDRARQQRLRQCPVVAQQHPGAGFALRGEGTCPDS